MAADPSEGVYVPTTDAPVPGDRRVELRRAADGRVLLFGYSGVARMHALYRRDCRWARLGPDELAALQMLVPHELVIDAVADLVVVDPRDAS
ncbi:hypothetical protein SAMN04488570_0367 [Nocardioides scoriae]|uniref:Uncharacterized protein n=1 Tax=Nocardioides scoriae TaxID=642780 RepID=A0A1H1LUB0_9ACTN|nr:hypothetical protein [Nocardioides scoriae]SDR78218.1 hypothetical protein SAMN04488570_0367 [Nocardioides scoriae]